MKRGVYGIRGLWLIVVVVVVGMQSGVQADARSDLDDARREFGSVTSHYNSAKQKLEDFLTVFDFGSSTKTNSMILSGRSVGSILNATETTRPASPRTCETRQSSASRARTTTQ